MSDSRMFLAPVPIVNGIAYSGTAGFTNPTLGVFVEWWLNCETDVTHDNSGKEALCYAIAGSPLTGINGCGCVYPDGTTERIVYGKFSNVWRTFVQINQRYTEVKQIAEAYSLQEVYDKLK